MGANLTFARCLDGSCDWWSDVQPGISITFLATEAQQHADATGHAVHLTYTIPARPGCDPVPQPLRMGTFLPPADLAETARQQAQAEDDIEATRLGLCRCSSADEDVRATDCVVHGMG